MTNIPKILFINKTRARLIYKKLVRLQAPPCSPSATSLASWYVWVRRMIQLRLIRGLHSLIKTRRCGTKAPSCVSHCITKVESCWKLICLNPRFQARFKPKQTTSNSVVLLVVVPRWIDKPFNQNPFESWRTLPPLALLGLPCDKRL